GLALKYCQGGASAISVLTDTKGFGGSLEDLKQVANALSTKYPKVSVLRKDFIIHRLQLAEAVLAGANAVLLIANVVGYELKSLLLEAKSLGLETLTEVHDMADLELALKAEAPIIGINHRNLSTFEIGLDISDTLRPLIPSHVIAVAESGIHNTVSAKRMRDLGYDAILVGEALVRSDDPIKLIELMQG
ncbi:MAG: indole-3-glycerol-phosphate synthase, partial [Parachlamydiaceae bacterium]|nr:indole-3-glycerol-phosphate synthase [Parachlamydiaceae bacterium]